MTTVYREMAQARARAARTLARQLAAQLDLLARETAELAATARAVGDDPDATRGEMLDLLGVLADTPRRPRAPGRPQPPANLAQLIEKTRHTAADLAHACGASWTDIGAALGIARQGARIRYGTREDT